MDPALEELILRAQEGDAAAYEDIVRRFEEMALQYAYSILGDYDLAEDARQEAFLGAYLDLMSLRDPAAFPGWFKRIVHNRSVSLIRGRAPELTVPLESAGELAATQKPNDEALEEQEREERIREAIADLPEAEAEVTRLYYLEGYSQRETAMLLGLQAKTVKGRLHRARRRLKLRLMDMVKRSTSPGSGGSGNERRRLRDAAGREAIRRFDQEMRQLASLPAPEHLDRWCELLCAKGRMQRFLGQYAGALESFRGGLEAPGLELDPMTRARLRAELGLTYVQQADYEEARRELEASRLALRRRKQKGPLLAATLNGLGICAWGNGEFKQARRFYEETRDLSLEGDCPELAAEAANNLALLDWKNGRLEEALAHLRDCHKEWQRLNNRYGAGVALMNMGILEENLGRLKMARRHYGQALELAEQIEFLQLRAAVRTNLGSLAMLDGEWAVATEHNDLALADAQQIGDRRSEAICLENRALIAQGLGEHKAADRALAEARRLARRIGDEERLFSLALVEIEGLLRQGRHEKDFEQRFADLEAIAQRKGYGGEQPRLLRLRAWAAWLEGDDRAARRLEKRARRAAEEQKNQPEALRLKELRKLRG